MTTRKEWDDRFRQGDHVDSAPDPFFTTSRRYWPMIPGWRAQAERPGSSTGSLSALDLACGAGRHAVELAQAGFQATAVDFSSEGLSRARALARKHKVSIERLEKDLEAEEADLGEAAYDLVVVFFYLHRPLFSALRRCLRRGGLIVYKTYSVDQLLYPGRPRHRAVMLEHNELLKVCAGFRVLRYEEEWEGKGTAALIAQKA